MKILSRQNRGHQTRTLSWTSQTFEYATNVPNPSLRLMIISPPSLSNRDSRSLTRSSDPLAMLPLGRLLSPLCGRSVSAIAFPGIRKLSTSLRPKILLLGDSLTQEGTDPDLGGWVCQLQHRYTRSADVVVRGLYGYSTEIFIQHALPGLKDELASWSEPPAFVALWLGGNDSALLSGYEAALHVPVPKYCANLREIVGSIQKEAPDVAILMITPPAVNDQARLDAWSDPDGEIDFSNDGVAEYAQACIEEAEAMGVPCLDVFTVMNEMNEQERCACQYDGLHFNQKGNKLIVEQVLAAIEREFPSLAKRLDTWEHPDYLELLNSTPLKENKLF